MSNTFQRPKLNRLILRLFAFINLPLLSRGITWVVDEESLDHWRAVPKNSGLFLASKHAHFNDHFCIGGLADRLGIYPYYVSIPEAFADFWGLAGMIVKRLGGFPVERGGSNIQATRFIVECLVKGERPLIIFPEGELHFLSDIVTPLKPGIALFALEGAKARKLAGVEGDVYLSPIGIKYVFRENPEPYLRQKLDTCEKILFGKKRSGEITSRIESLEEEVLLKHERELGISTTGSTSDVRLNQLAAQLLDRLDEQAFGKVGKGDPSDRARILLNHFEKEKDQDKIRQVRFILHAVAFYPGYMSDPTPERQMDMARKLERIITGHENPSFPGKRFLFVKINPAIAAGNYLASYLDRQTKREAIERLTHDLQSSMQQAVDDCNLRANKAHAGKEKVAV